MFSLRKNSNNDRKNKTKINFENWKDIVTYPEHKNKSKDLLHEDDLENNVQLIDRTEEFQNQVERFARDQRWRNKNITQNATRDKKNEEEMTAWLKSKEVVSNFTVQENNIFFKKKFNGDRNKIIDFYKKSMDSIFEASGIDKDRIVFATIHFDQSNPHLHFSISNLKEKEYKTLGRTLLTVNGNDFNPVNQMKKLQNKRQAWLFKNKLSLEEQKLFRDKGFQNTFKTKYVEHLNFHKPIFEAINKKYDSKIYANSKDHISMERIRGYKRNVTKDKLNTLEWHNLKNKLIFKFRETKLLKEIESSERINKDNPKVLLGKRLKYTFQMKNLKDKYKASIDNKEQSLKPNIPEQNMLNKKKYFIRKDIDLFMLFGNDKFKKMTNDIQKNRLYNELLWLCHEKELTPQKLINEVYYGDYIPIKFKEQKLLGIQKAILTRELKKSDRYKITYEQKLNTNRNIYSPIRKGIERDINKNIDQLRLFINIDRDKNISSDLEKQKASAIGVDANFIKRINARAELSQTKTINDLQKKYKFDLYTIPSFKKEINKKLDRFSFTNTQSFKALKSHFIKPSVIDSLQKSIDKEIEAINRLQEKNRRDIEWENEL